MENHYIMYCVSITMKIDLQELNGEWKWKVVLTKLYRERGVFDFKEHSVYYWYKKF